MLQVFLGASWHSRCPCGFRSALAPSRPLALYNFIIPNGVCAPALFFVGRGCTRLHPPHTRLGPALFFVGRGCTRLHPPRTRLGPDLSFVGRGCTRLAPASASHRFAPALFLVGCGCTRLAPATHPLRPPRISSGMQLRPPHTRFGPALFLVGRSCARRAPASAPLYASWGTVVPAHFVPLAACSKSASLFGPAGMIV